MKKMILLLMVSVFVSSCRDKSEEYYEKNTDEAENVVKECKENGDLELNENCKNAYSAYRKKLMGDMLKH